MVPGVVLLHSVSFAGARVHDSRASEADSGIGGDVADVSGGTVHTGVKFGRARRGCKSHDII